MLRKDLQFLMVKDNFNWVQVDHVTNFAGL